jgi:hypothetical protein
MCAEGKARELADTRGKTKAGRDQGEMPHLVIAIRGADNAGGLNAVVMAGSEALLFLWRPALTSRGISAEIGPALLVATSVVRRALRLSVAATAES